MYCEWKDFIKTGKVSDYLKYKDININPVSFTNIKETHNADNIRGDSALREDNQRERQVY